MSVTYPRVNEGQQLHRIAKFLFSLFFLVSISRAIHSSAYTATYYVDNSCANNGDGSSQTCAASPGEAGPFNSIANMQAKLGGYTAGDKILLRRGLTFSDSRLTFSWSGTAGNVITLGAYGEGANPLLNPDLDYPLYLTGNSYVTIDSVDVLTTVADSVAIRQAGTQDHITLQNMTSQGVKSAHFSQDDITNQTVTNCSFITSGTNTTYGMYFFGSTNKNITISNCTFTTTTAADLYGIYFLGTINGDITISDIHLDHAIMRFANIENLSLSNIVASESGNSNMGLIGILDGSGILSISNVNSTNALGYGLTIADSPFTAGNATVTEFNHSSSSSVSGNGINISNSSYIDISDFYVKGMTNGVMIGSGSHHISLADGIAEYNYGDGMDTIDTVHDVTFARCIARNNGLKTEPAPQSGGDGFSTHETNYNINFYYSQAYNNTNSALALWGQSAGLVYNFIGYNNGGDWTGDGGSPTDRGGLAVHVSSANPVNGQTYIVKNSIFMNNYPVEVNTTEYWIGATTSDSNIYYPKNNDDFYNFSDNTSTHYSWDQYHTTNGYEANSLNADPLFIDAGTDFHLQSGSPAIDAGVDVALTIDCAGNSVPQGSAQDIGAYEFSLPSAAASLAQYESDGNTGITTGGLARETSVITKFTMSSANSSDSLIPQVEIQPVGTSFTNTQTHSGGVVAYSGTPVTGSVTVTGLTDAATYHWQARISNPAGPGSWTSYGANDESTGDITIAVPTPTSANSPPPAPITSDNSSSSSASAPSRTARSQGNKAPWLNGAIANDFYSVAIISVILAVLILITVVFIKIRTK